MTDKNIGKVGHNLKFDYLVLKRGLTVEPLTLIRWSLNG